MDLLDGKDKAHWDTLPAAPAGRLLDSGLLFSGNDEGTSTLA